MHVDYFHIMSRHGLITFSGRNNFTAATRYLEIAPDFIDMYNIISAVKISLPNSIVCRNLQNMFVLSKASQVLMWTYPMILYH